MYLGKVPGNSKVAVIGAGWAGCAAAVELSRKNCHVTLFEAARTMGGRARQVIVDGHILDNGQHILLGAYRETLRLMQTVGIDPNAVLLRLPLQMRYPHSNSGMHFITPRLPAPLHMFVGLMRAEGLSGRDKLALARFFTTARWMGWQLYTDCSVSELLARFEQTDALFRLLWRPLCIAALNTPPERASAQIFLNVLRDSLGANRSASDMLIPRVDLTALFPACALKFIQQQKGTVHCGTAIKKITPNKTRWKLQWNEQGSSSVIDEEFDAIVVATQPEQALHLLQGVTDLFTLSAFQYEPITTCYLQYGGGLKLNQPFYALEDDGAAGHWGQFVFDRGQTHKDQVGLLAVVVSASSDAIKLGHSELATRIATQLAQVFQRPELSQPMWVKIISEKRATFACSPGIARPDNDTGRTGLFIAGDYTAGEYPATLEAAVRSGIRAAKMLQGSNRSGG